jgi:hypothetical protein
MKVFFAVIGFVFGSMVVLLQLEGLPELPATLATLNAPGTAEAAGKVAGYVIATWVSTLCAAGLALKCGLFLHRRKRL